MKLLRMITSIRLCTLVALLAAVSGTYTIAAGTQPDNNPLPHLVSQDGRHALFVDGAPFLILGAQCHNSSAWPAMLPKVWPAIEYLHANTLEIPVYWEQFEPEPDKFDTSVVDTHPERSPRASRAADAALVRHLEERQLALPAALGEAPARQVPADHRQNRPPRRFAVAARPAALAG